MSAISENQNEYGPERDAIARALARCIDGSHAEAGIGQTSMNRKYRLGLVVHHPVPYQVPFYRALARDPHIDPLVIYLDDRVLKGVYVSEFETRIKFDRALLDGYPHVFSKNISPWTDSAIVNRVNPDLFRTIYKNKFDAVLVTGYNSMSSYFAMLAARLSGAKLFIRAEADLTNPANTLFTKIKKKTLPSVLRWCDAAMYSCQRNRDYFVHYGVPPDRTFPLLSSVDNAGLSSMRPQALKHRSELRAKFGIPGDAIVILFVGRLTERKRVLDLLNASAELLRTRHDVWLTYVGEGPLRTELMAQASAEGVSHRVVLTGYQEGDDIPGFYGASDIFVLPSAYDTSAKVVNEAMVFELPVVASDGIGPIDELIRDEQSGLVFNVGDVAALKQRIHRLVNDPALRKRLGKAGSVSVADWSPEANVAGVLDALRYCVGEKPGSASGAARKTVRLAHLLSHPIQYKSPLLRRIAQEPDIDLTVFYRTDFSVTSYLDSGFGIRIGLDDVDLLSGYRHQFLPVIGSRAQATFWRPFNYGQGRLLRAGKYDAIWVHGYGSFYSWWSIARAKVMGLKVLLTDEAHLRSRARHGFGELRARLIFAFLKRYVDVFLSIGRANADYYRYRGVDESKIFRMPFAVDGTAFAPRRPASRAEAKQQILYDLGIAEERTVILFASKLMTRKRCIDLIQAFLRLDRKAIRPPPLLLIVGDGVERTKLELLVSNLGLGKDVRFLGFRTQTELPQLYQASDVFVLPSRDEPVGYVILEAMNAGCAIVASEEIGAAQDLVIDGVNGYVFPAGDVAALASKLTLLLSDNDRLKQASAASRRIISAWDFEADVVGLRQALGLPETPDRCTSSRDPQDL